MLPSRLRVTRTHLGIARHLIRCMGSVSGASSSSGSFAGVHFGLVSTSGSHVAVISGLELVPVCSGLITCSCSLKITFSYVRRFVSALSRACALAIKFGCVPDFVFTFACTRASCSPESLFAAFALPRAFTLVE